MKALSLHNFNTKLVAPGCFDLPSHRDGQRTVTCWELEEGDIERIIAEADTDDPRKLLASIRFYLGIIGGESQPPVQVSTESLLHKSADCMMIIGYTPALAGPDLQPFMLWNTCDIDAPLTIKTNGGLFKRIPQKIAITYYHDPEPGQGVIMWRPDDGARVLVMLDANKKETIYEL